MATTQDLKNLGFHIDKYGVARKIAKMGEQEKIKKPKPKTISNEKNFIEFALIAAKVEYAKEYRFDKIRRFRFDYAAPSIKVAWEYDGLVFNSNKAISTGMSGHTSVLGFTSNCTKINLAQLQGWRVFRYTALNYHEIVNDLKEILK